MTVGSRSKIVAIGLLLIVAMLGVYLSVSDRGQRDFPVTTQRSVDIDRVLASARALDGTLYDLSMGRFSNLGGRLGFIVCSDVPVIAYGEAGFSFEAELTADFRRDASRYDSADGNVPGNPYFHRRARNLLAYFESKGSLQSAAAQPRPGDLAFYKKSSHTFATHVALVTRVDVPGDYWIFESAPKTLLAGEVRAESALRRGWQLLGFGRVPVPGS